MSKRTTLEIQGLFLVVFFVCVVLLAYKVGFLIFGFSEITSFGTFFGEFFATIAVGLIALILSRGDNTKRNVVSLVPKDQEHKRP